MTVMTVSVRKRLRKTLPKKGMVIGLKKTLKKGNAVGTKLYQKKKPQKHLNEKHVAHATKYA